MIGTKKTVLLALTAGALISPAVMAADVDGPSGNWFWGEELLGLAATDDVTVTDTIAVALGSEYAVGDKVTLAFSGDALDDTTLPTSVVSVCTVAGEGTTATAGMTWGLLNSDSGQGTWRVTEIDTSTCVDGTSTTGKVVEFGPAFTVEFDANAVLANSGIVVAFSAETNAGDPLDTLGGIDRTTTVITVESEVGYSVTTKFSAIIDVNQDRMVLLPTGWDFGRYGLDELELPEDLTGGFGITFLTADVTWTGDFSWINDGDEMTADIQPLGDTVIAGGCDPASVVVTASEITAECGAFDANLQLDPRDNGNPELAILPAGTFQVSIVNNYDDDGFWDGTARTGSVAFNNLAAGAWALNGYQAELPYMPFGTGITQVIYLANRGMQTGDITVDYIDRDGNAESLGVIATINPSSTLSIGPAIQAALPQSLQDSGRLALTITANIPAEDGQVNSQYNVNGNRAFVLQDDNRPDLDVGLAN